jgi:hypothetical protein
MTPSALHSEPVQRAWAESAGIDVATAPPQVHRVLRSSGQPLDGGVRSRFEGRLGQDLTGVRVHSDASAAVAASEVKAKAFTVGHHLVFGGEQLQPNTSRGDSLLAHELAHVVQHRAAGPTARRLLQRESDDSDPAEQRAREKAATQQRKQERAAAGKDFEQLTAREAEQELRDLERSYHQPGAQQRSVARKDADLERFRKLLTRIPGAPLEKSKRQGAFAELQRTPTSTAGAPQTKHVAGGPQTHEQELRPGKESYAQPDWSLWRRRPDGSVERIHVNLKSDDLNSLTIGQARTRARPYLEQAVRNSRHLAEGEGIVIHFTQTPSKEIQAEMNATLFSAGSPVTEVRYGTTTHYRPAPTVGKAPATPSPAPPRKAQKAPAKSSKPAPKAAAPTPAKKAATPKPAAKAPTPKPAKTPAAKAAKVPTQKPAKPTVHEPAAKGVSHPPEAKAAAPKPAAKAAVHAESVKAPAHPPETHSSAPTPATSPSTPSGSPVPAKTETPAAPKAPPPSAPATTHEDPNVHAPSGTPARGQPGAAVHPEGGAHVAPKTETPAAPAPKAGWRGALVPAGYMGLSFLTGLLVAWYQNERFKEEWADRMAWVENWLHIYLPAIRPNYPAGTQLFAVVEMDIETSDAYMAEPGWQANAPGLKVHAVRVTTASVPDKSEIVDKSSRWTMLLGFSYETQRVTFSFPLPSD